jgi:hypothetical protein
MIPADNEFEVFVSEGVLVEVWHGQKVSTARDFAEDWDGPVRSMIHLNAFTPPGAPVIQASDPAPHVPRRRSREFDVCIAMFLGVIVGVLLWLGSACRWW